MTFKFPGEIEKIPGGCSELCQPVAVIIDGKEPLKARAQQLWDEMDSKQGPTRQCNFIFKISPVDMVDHRLSRADLTVSDHHEQYLLASCRELIPSLRNAAMQ